MARINISEFQFAFAFFHKFMNLPDNQGKNFIVPSLLQEGGRGLSESQKDLKGTDLVIEDSYFFQFKMCDRLVNSSKQTKNAKLASDFLPFFRFNIKNSSLSHQFNALVDLAKTKGSNKVYYISPVFDYSGNRNDDEAFEDFWKSEANVAMDKIAWIDFSQWSQSNPLQSEKNDNHVICYNKGSVEDGLGYMFSEKKEIQISKFDLNLLNKPNTSLSTRDEIRQIANILKGLILDKHRIIVLEELLYNNSITDFEAIYLIQEILVFEFNIMWLPIVKNKIIK